MYRNNVLGAPAADHRTRRGNVLERFATCLRHGFVGHNIRPRPRLSDNLLDWQLGSPGIRW